MFTSKQNKKIPEAFQKVTNPDHTVFETDESTISLEDFTHTQEREKK